MTKRADEAALEAAIIANKKPMTDREQEVAVQVIYHYRQTGSGWYRASGNGERVTLASLHRKGLLRRRAWRGTEGDVDAAHEYYPSSNLLGELARHAAATAGRS